MPSPGLCPAPTTIAILSFKRMSVHSRDRVLLEYLFVSGFVVDLHGGEHARLRPCLAIAFAGDVATMAAAVPSSARIISTVRSASLRSRSATSTLAPARASKIAAARPLPIPSPAAPPLI